jgi:hypothetical protein
MRILHSDKFNGMYSLSSIITIPVVKQKRDKEKAYRIFEGKPYRKQPFRRPGSKLIVNLLHLNAGR